MTDFGKVHTQNEIKHPEMARKIQRAIDLNGQIPPLQYGQYPWFVARFKERGLEISTEHVRKWVQGISAPSKQNRLTLSEVLNVDPGWLVPDGGRRRLDLEPIPANPGPDVTGQVNLVAGMIQMQGGTVSFVDPGDQTARPEHDLVTIIRGAHYNIHVAFATKEGEGAWLATLNASPKDAVVIAVIEREGFAYDLVEVALEDVVSTRVARLRGIGVPIQRRDDGYYCGDRKMRQIESFSNRL